MKLTKYGHACVRLEKDGRSLVIDPGELTLEGAATAGVDAVLITHEHADHYSLGRLWGIPEVYASPGIVRILEDLDDFRELDHDNIHAVREGDTFEVAGFNVRVFGEKHHLSNLDVPPVDNVGFLIDDEVFHPGDALTRVDVPTLLVPGQAPWLTAPMTAAYLRAVRPERAFAIHDGLVNKWGLEVMERVLAMESERAGRPYRRMEIAESVEL
ncbi:MBL fold metallo-hydrolase [Actinomadura rupiterrae]|uniref:MBL fold metallo-hydrolase n=1 Tax=Actinomadura rupiterrae TaxID=559627 RepID=UPI0020A38EE1|nr:MBL fold metallo-hydrolase [Actinomadura rupiterrae]MCP2339414.1 L-ascorbate metabolism protein UlaG (beta-lactamase superfamily) [Actinomadura rupiterrae]